MSLEELSQIAAIIGSIIAAVSLVYVALQLRHSVRIADGQFLLELEKMTYLHDEVHLKLRPGGEWSKYGKGPDTTEEWAKLEDYMGFFEHCELLIRNKSLNYENFKKIFGYRVFNIVANKIIVNNKLVAEREEWEFFVSLMKRMDINI